MNISFSALPGAVAIAAAGFLAFEGTSNWGWFLIVGFLVSATPSIVGR